MSSTKRALKAVGCKDLKFNKYTSLQQSKYAKAVKQEDSLGSEEEDDDFDQSESNPEEESSEEEQRTRKQHKKGKGRKK